MRDASAQVENLCCFCVRVFTWCVVRWTSHPSFFFLTFILHNSFICCSSPHVHHFFCICLNWRSAVRAWRHARVEIRSIVRVNIRVYVYAPAFVCLPRRTIAGGAVLSRRDVYIHSCAPANTTLKRIYMLLCSFFFLWLIFKR